MKISIKLFFILYISVLFFMPAFGAQTIADKKKEITAMYNSNNINEAYSLISRITEDERDYEMWYLLANISQDRGSNANAVFFLQKSLLLNPDFDKAHYNLGNIYLSENRYNLAVNEYQNAIRIKKDFAFYYYNLGCAYLGLKEYKNAKNAFEKAVKLKGDEANFYYNLAIAYKNLDYGDKMNEALGLYNKLRGKTT